MAKGIGQAHKLGRQNRQQPGSTNDSSNRPSVILNSHDIFNENIDIKSKEYLTSVTLNSKKYFLHDEPSNIIQIEPVSSLATKT